MNSAHPNHRHSLTIMFLTGHWTLKPANLTAMTNEMNSARPNHIHWRSCFSSLATGHLIGETYVRIRHWSRLRSREGYKAILPIIIWFLVTRFRSLSSFLQTFPRFQNHLTIQKSILIASPKSRTFLKDWARPWTSLPLYLSRSWNMKSIWKSERKKIAPKLDGMIL